MFNMKPPTPTNHAKRQSQPICRKPQRQFPLESRDRQVIKVTSCVTALGGRLAVAVGDLQAWLQLAGCVHQAPFVFPCSAWLVIYDLPWLVKGLEPT